MFINGKAIDKKYGLNIDMENESKKECCVISTKSCSVRGAGRMVRSQITKVILPSLRFLHFSAYAKASADPVEMTVYKNSIQYNSMDNATYIRIHMSQTGGSVLIIKQKLVCVRSHGHGLVP
jgi:hypothetical protein